MIIIKNEEEIEKMRAAGEIMKEVHNALYKSIKPGVTTEQLDKIIEDIILSHGAISAEKGYPNFYEGKPAFPGNACISVNEEIIHGVPGKRMLKTGDIVSIDLVIKYNGYHADAARTYIVGKANSKKDENLVITTEEAFFEGIKYAKPGYRIGDISNAIEAYVKSKGFNVIKEYQGHGIGASMHEEPMIPNYGKAGTGPRIKKGMTLAIEPMVVSGSSNILDNDPDGWTVVTYDGKPSAHYENTVLVTDDEPEILTL